MKLKTGDRIKVKASKSLGTPAVMGTIVDVDDECYQVHCDGDDAEWYGPVAEDGCVMSASYNGLVRME